MAAVQPLGSRLLDSLQPSCRRRRVVRIRSYVMAANDQLVSHLLRRAGFGASQDDLSAFVPLSYSRAVDRLVDYEAIADTVDSNIGQAGFVGTTSRGAFSPNTVADDARQRWLFRMVHSGRPL